MSRLLEYRQRLSVITNIDKIIKAMQTVTVGKVRKSQQTLKTCNSFRDQLARIISGSFEELEPFNDTFVFEKSPQKSEPGNRPVLLVLFTASRSFSGDFTEKIFQKSAAFVREKQLAKVHYLVVGLKGAARAKNKNLPGITDLKISENPNFPDAQKLARAIMNRFHHKEYSEIYFIFNHFKSILIQEPAVTRVFPYPDELKPAQRAQALFFWEPSLETVAQSIFRQYLEIKIYQIYFESYASELAARMINLKAASESGQELIKSLTIQINKARQARITEELTEIISSYEVIREEN
jgi:F-type H+-transporting ATPase subunit gamma